VSFPDLSLFIHSCLLYDTHENVSGRLRIIKYIKKEDRF